MFACLSSPKQRSIQSRPSAHNGPLPIVRLGKIWWEIRGNRVRLRVPGEKASTAFRDRELRRNEAGEEALSLSDHTLHRMGRHRRGISQCGARTDPSLPAPTRERLQPYLPTLRHNFLLWRSPIKMTKQTSGMRHTH